MKSEKEIFIERVKRELNPQDRILDLGCMEDYAPGKNVHRELKQAGFIVTGADIIKQPGVDVVTDLNKHFPFKPRSFDVVLAMEIIEHLVSPLYFIKRCHTILSPGGRLVLTTPNACSIIMFTETYKDFYPSEKYPHLQYLDKHSAHRLMSMSGFKNINVECHASHFSKNIPMRVLQKLVVPWRSNLLIVGEKE